MGLTKFESKIEKKKLKKKVYSNDFRDKLILVK